MMTDKQPHSPHQWEKIQVVNTGLYNQVKRKEGFIIVF